MSNEIKQIPLSQLNSFENHPFIEYTGERLDKMVRSIGESGIHSPLIVREKNDVYEILSGHNRANAARMLSWETAPCIVKENCSDDEAKLIVTETNFHQRAFADYKPSEKAKSIKMYNDAVRALKSQDVQNYLSFNADNDDIKATETVVGHDVPRVHTRDKSALQFGLSGRNISRYERLALLVPEWLNKVDEGELGIVPANEVTYLTRKRRKHFLSM
ncbi:hypothetical protein FACS1894133_5190 [Clostridia bacterium]|nr:hypothetical protein FACS1894133_5190 [Clostridia bacterium]